MKLYRWIFFYKHGEQKKALLTLAGKSSLYELNFKETWIMVLLEFSMSPMDKGESVSDYVSRSLKIVSESGVDYRLNPMGTVLEGEWEEVMDVVKKCYETMSSDCKRITCSVKIDYRKGKKGRLESKMATVEKKLGKKLRM